MGGFALFKKNEIIEESFIDCFKRKGLNRFKKFELDDYRLLLFNKIHCSNINYFTNECSSIFSTGTIIYKGLFDETALKLVLNNYQNGTLDISEIIGDFCILLYINERISIFTDQANIYNVFFTIDLDMISSSFITICKSLPHHITINRQATVEVLLTGNLIGPDTLFNEVKRYEIGFQSTSPNLNFINKVKEFRKITYTSSNEAIEQQICQLDSYIDSISGFANKYGLCLGLTGGFDSRLLLAVLTRNPNFFKKNLKIYSTWRKKITTEFKNAETVASVAGMNILSIEHRELIDLSTDEAAEMLINNMWFNDGLVRTHQLWTEEIKTSNYLSKLVLPNLINTSGVGGEQYRNSDRLFRIKHNFEKWVKYKILFKHNSNPFLTNNEFQDFYVYFSSKLQRKLSLNNTRSISFQDMKRYGNEIYNPANRTVRNNIENQLYYFLSPFTDFNISNFAYNAIPYLGIDFSFEARMISKISPELANVISDYGFPPSIRYSFSQRISSLANSVIPFRVLWEKSKKKKQSNSWDIITKHLPFLESYIANIYNIKLGIDLRILLKSEFLWPLLVETGLLFELLKDKIDEEIK
jgi:hypothetical protein